MARINRDGCNKRLKLTLKRFFAGRSSGLPDQDVSKQNRSGRRNRAIQCQVVEH